MYAKLTESGELDVAPNPLVMEASRICNPTAAQYAAAGYLPVRLADKPIAPEGKRYVPVYTMGDGEIIQSWTLEDWENKVTMADVLKAIERGLNV